MDLENNALIRRSAMKRYSNTLFCSLLFLFSLVASSYAHPGSPQEPKLIIDTEVAEETENTENEKPKERNPLLAEENIGIGNYYLKEKNYIAAIRRYLAALEYQPDSVAAHEGLGRAYEKNGDISKALQLYKKFLEENPNSPKSPVFKNRIAKLTKKS
jgi:tetratricopeptide (TPR) repeat protein